MTSHTREHCPGKLVQSFWLPSDCPQGLRGAASRLDALVDGEAVHWDGRSDHVTAFYRCHCCGFEWSESDWPAVLLFGLGWRGRHHDPVHWVAGVDAPRHLARDFTVEGRLLAG